MNAGSCCTFRWLASLLVTVAVGFSASADADPINADLLLAGGQIHDGTGEAPVVGDVAVRGDRIVAVGQFETGKIGRTVDCTGLVIAPGFIDLHNHSDQKVTDDQLVDGKKTRLPRVLASQTRPGACFLTQGCTTIVTGNCGGGVLDTARYYEQLDETPPGVNVAHLIPQGAVRGEVIGSTQRQATAEELQEMRRLVRQNMRAGAWGMSTGLIYVPSSYADTDEIAALAREVAAQDGVYASHIRGEGSKLLDSVEEAIQIGRLSGAPVHISHFKASGKQNWGSVRAAAALIQQARDAGQRITADQYPYAASSTSIAAMLLPGSEREGGSRALRKRLTDPESLARLRPMIQRRLEQRGEIMVASCSALPDWVGRLLSEIAEAEEKEPADVAIKLIVECNAAGVSFSMDEKDVRWVMSLPWAATASDGSLKVDDGTNPHPRSYGTFPRRIGRYAIEEGVVPLPMAIRSASGLPADILGMHGRGYLREGCYADIVAFDPQEFRDLATFKSPHQLSKGVAWLLVNGQLAIADGKLDKTDAGRALRKPAKQVALR